MRIRYVLRPSDREGHRARLSLEADDVGAPELDLVLPSWVPGSYHLVNYVRGFRGMTARRLPEGTPLPVDRVASTRWRVGTEGASRVRVDYSVYGYDLVTEGFDVTDEHMFVNAALALPFVDGHLNEPAEVELHAPPGWQVVTELETVGRDPLVLRARDYDQLVDSPIDVGRPLVLTIRPQGIPHRIALCGEGGNYEAHRIEEDLGKIVDATVRLFGESPLSSYTFFVHLTDAPDGALEHASSNSAVVDRSGFAPRPRYERFLLTQSHEYFHLYNVKRIRPKVLGPFDYTRETYTRQLWWMEGGTDYFAILVLRRAGIFSPPRFLDELAAHAKILLETPGRNSLSLEALSRLAWVDYYQPFEESPNQSVSYYVKGALASLALDLEIRHATGARTSLETVVRGLWEEYGRAGRGLEEAELETAIGRCAGVDLSEFFSKYIRGTTELDLDRFARYAGLTFGPRPKDPEDDSPVPGYLGVRFEDRGGFARVTRVLLDTPAHRAGLSPGDEIVGLNRTKVTGSGFEKALEGFPPGTPVELAFFRRGYLHERTLTTTSPPPAKYRFTSFDGADDAARAVHLAWLGAPWEPAKAGPSRGG